MFNWNWKPKPKPEIHSPWNLTVKEAIEKHGSATKVLDALAKDVYPRGTVFDPVVGLMLLERYEKILKKRKKK
jgi:hypothetical protein